MAEEKPEARLRFRCLGVSGQRRSSKMKGKKVVEVPFAKIEIEYMRSVEFT